MENYTENTSEPQGENSRPRKTIRELSDAERAALARQGDAIHRGIRLWRAANRDAPEDFEPLCEAALRRIRDAAPLATLRAQRQWVVWQWGYAKGKPRVTKIPCRADNPSRRAASDNPSTWSDFDTAVANVHRAAGMGFMLWTGDICAFDLDKCRDPATGALALWARQLLEECRSYAEITPSGTGLRIIGYGQGDEVQQTVPRGEKLDCLPKEGELEIYRKTKRYITVTGDALDEYNVDLVNIDAAIDRNKRQDKAKKAKGDAPKDAPKGNGAKRPAPDSVLEAIRSDDTTGHISVRLFDVVGKLKTDGWTADEIEALMLENPGAISAKYVGRLRTEIDRAYNKFNVNEFKTDLGNARRLVRRHGTNIRYVHPFKAWFIWKGNYWMRDDNGEIMRLAADTVEAMFDEATEIANEARRTELRKHAIKSQGRKEIVNMVALAQNDIVVSLSPNALDADPMLLGVRNGVIDLNTGKFTEGGRREDYITKRCAVAYDPNAKCPKWVAFQERIATNSDKELIAYKQRMFGLSLTGQMVEILFIMHGKGANGKTTEAETIHAVLGDYACAANASLLVSAHERGAATPEVVALKGKRAVFINETNESDHLNEARVKYITSNTTMSARDLYEKQIDFKPTHKPFLQTNHKPNIRGTDKGMWRRIHRVPYLVTIAEKDKQEDYREKVLMPELPGILNWLLAGLKQYLKIGLKPPPIVCEATEEYRKEMDTFGLWFGLAIEGDPAAGAKMGLTQLYEHYVAWFEFEISKVAKPISNKKLADEMRERGYVSGKAKGLTYFFNVKLTFPKPY